VPEQGLLVERSRQEILSLVDRYSRLKMRLKHSFEDCFNFWVSLVIEDVADILA